GESRLGREKQRYEKKSRDGCDDTCGTQRTDTTARNGAAEIADSAGHCRAEPKQGSAQDWHRFPPSASADATGIQPLRQSATVGRGEPDVNRTCSWSSVVACPAVLEVRAWRRSVNANQSSCDARSGSNAGSNLIVWSCATDSSVRKPIPTSPQCRGPA